MSAENRIHSFRRKPSGFVTTWRIIRSRRNRYALGRAVPEICAERKDYSIDRGHLRRFNRICGLQKEGISILYPFTLVYPYIMRVLSSRSMPFSVLNILNIANAIVQKRSIREDDICSLRCRNGAPRVLPRGIELDIVSEVAVGGETVWSNITTYFAKGSYGKADKGSEPRRIRLLEQGEEAARWFFPAKDRFAFARVSGDTNGIHYMPSYARLFGFERDFAQPIRVVARCVDILPEPAGEGPVKLDFLLKGPVYYDRELALYADGGRFDLYCQGNDRPSVSGEMTRLS